MHTYYLVSHLDIIYYWKVGIYEYFIKKFSFLSPSAVSNKLIKSYFKLINENIHIEKFVYFLFIFFILTIFVIFRFIQNIKPDSETYTIE